MVSTVLPTTSGVAWSKPQTYAYVWSRNKSRTYLAMLRDAGYKIYVDNLIPFDLLDLGEKTAYALLPWKARCCNPDCKPTPKPARIRNSVSHCPQCWQLTTVFHSYDGVEYRGHGALPMPKCFLIAVSKHKYAIRKVMCSLKWLGHAIRQLIPRGKSRT